MSIELVRHKSGAKNVVEYLTLLPADEPPENKVYLGKKQQLCVL